MYMRVYICVYLQCGSEICLDHSIIGMLVTEAKFRANEEMALANHWEDRAKKVTFEPPKITLKIGNIALSPKPKQFDRDIYI